MGGGSNRTIVVVGAGHAGIEAAAAVVRLGHPCFLVTLRHSTIGEMSCNPAIGGVGKGHLVKEIDALGGVMGRAIDQTGIQFRTLNSSRGPAVRASRAQADRSQYRNWMQSYLSGLTGLTILEDQVVSIETRNGRLTGVSLKRGGLLPCQAVVVTAGTFLRGVMHVGSEQTVGGRRGDGAAQSLSGSLERLGFILSRLKTGTPPRLDRGSIDYARLQEQPGDVPARPFSMMTERIGQEQLPCWITSTNSIVHEIIAASRERSPLFNGQIKSRGPRYCPSIEDKVYRFADKNSHHIFLEPEGRDSNLVYPNGIATSLPVDVQQAFVQQIKGLEKARIVHFGYAVEYDCVDPKALMPTLQSKEIQGLFFAGQINGTSGYEEAAAQGLLAGANAALQLLGRPPLIFDRSQAYIGVMIDDLITKGVDEPYRMFTSRAEYRLILREDNAAARLCPIGLACGLLDQKQALVFKRLSDQFSKFKAWSLETRIKPGPAVNDWLVKNGSAALKDSLTLATLMRRPELGLPELLEQIPYHQPLRPDLVASLEAELKFAGYLARQEEDVARLRRVEAQRIPDNFCYDSVSSLRIEVRDKLKQHRPYSLGQALRIPGVTPSAVALLSVHLKR